MAAAAVAGAAAAAAAAGAAPAVADPSFWETLANYASRTKGFVSTYLGMAVSRISDYNDKRIRPTIDDLLSKGVKPSDLQYVPSDSLKDPIFNSEPYKSIKEEDIYAGTLFHVETVNLLVALATYKRDYATASARQISAARALPTRSNAIKASRIPELFPLLEYNLLKRYFLFVFCATKAANARNATANVLLGSGSGLVRANSRIIVKSRPELFQEMIRLTSAQIREINAAIDGIEYTPEELAAEEATTPNPANRIRARAVGLKSQILLLLGKDALGVSSDIPVILVAHYPAAVSLATNLGGFSPIQLTLEDEQRAAAATEAARNARIGQLIAAEEAANQAAIDAGTAEYGPPPPPFYGFGREGVPDAHGRNYGAAFNPLTSVPSWEDIYNALKSDVGPAVLFANQAALVASAKVMSTINAALNSPLATDARGFLTVGAYAIHGLTGAVFNAATGTLIGTVRNFVPGSGFTVRPIPDAEAGRAEDFTLGGAAAASSAAPAFGGGGAGSGSSGGAASASMGAAAPSFMNAAAATFTSSLMARAAAGETVGPRKPTGAVRGTSRELKASHDAGRSSISQPNRRKPIFKGPPNPPSGSGGGAAAASYNGKGGYRRTHRRRSHTHKRKHRAHRVKASRRARRSSRKAGRR
jgi:hypothetical protein